MDKKDDELLSIQYQIEKTGVRQKKLEEGYESVTKALKRSKRNNRIVLGLFLITIIGGLGAFWAYNNTGTWLQFDTTDTDNALVKEVDEMQRINDSLQIELAKLKSEIAAYKDTIGRQRIEKDTLRANPLEVPLVMVDTHLTTKENPKDTAITTQESTPVYQYQKQYCYPVKAFKRGDIGFIEVDYIKFFEGRKAVQEARKYHKAEYDFNAQGDTLFFLETNHFIMNENKKLRILELDENVRVKGVNQVNNGFSMKALQSIVARNPILLLEMRDGIVYRISEKKI